MGILMMNENQFDQGSLFIQEFYDGFVGFIGAEALKLAGFLCKVSTIVQRGNDGEVVKTAYVKVINAMTRSRMNCACAGLVGNVLP